MYEDKIWMRSDKRCKERKELRVLGGEPTLSAQLPKGDRKTYKRIKDQQTRGTLKTYET